MILPLFYRKFIAFFIAFTLVVPGFYTAVQTQKALADEAVFEIGLQLVEMIIQVIYKILSYAEDLIIEVETTITAIATDYLALKEEVLDPIAKALSALLSGELVDMMFNFIAGGNEGAPAFVTNPQAFFGGVAEEATQVFLTDLFENRPDRMELINEVVRLRIIAENYVDPEQMMKSDFPGGDAGYQAYLADPADCDTGNSWDCYFSSLQPQNNPWDIYLFESQKLAGQRANDVKLSQDEILAGSGYHTLKECVEEDVNQNCMEYLNNIPGGDLIRQVDGYLQNAVKLLQTADEVDEVITDGIGMVEEWMNGKGLADMVDCNAQNPDGTPRFVGGACG